MQQENLRSSRTYRQLENNASEIGPEQAVSRIRPTVYVVGRRFAGETSLISMLRKEHLLVARNEVLPPATGAIYSVGLLFLRAAAELAGIDIRIQDCLNRCVVLHRGLGASALRHLIVRDVGDIVRTPCSVSELAWRIRRIAGLSNAPTIGCSRMLVPTLDTSSRTLRGSAATARLSSTECQLFELLRKHLGQTVSKQAIYDALWASRKGDAANVNVVNVYVTYLRRKLRYTSPRLTIECVRRAGYVLKVDSLDQLRQPAESVGGEKPRPLLMSCDNDSPERAAP